MRDVHILYNDLFNGKPKVNMTGAEWGPVDDSSEHGNELIYSFYLILKKSCIYKNCLGNAHAALCSTFLQASYSIMNYRVPYKAGHL
jgi:hypothetical protein